MTFSMRRRNFAPARSQQTYCFGGRNWPDDLRGCLRTTALLAQANCIPVDPVAKDNFAGGNLMRIFGVSVMDGKRSCATGDMLARLPASIGYIVAWSIRVGGNGKAVFDGASFALGRMARSSRRRSRSKRTCFVRFGNAGWESSRPPRQAGRGASEDASATAAWFVARRDYVRQADLSK